MKCIEHLSSQLFIIEMSWQQLKRPREAEVAEGPIKMQTMFSVGPCHVHLTETVSKNTHLILAKCVKYCKV